MSEKTTVPESFWVYILICLCALWACGMTYFGYQELRDAPVVHGLFRGYTPPYESADGWVVDPRENRLLDELYTRYGQGDSWRPPSPVGFAAWEKQIGEMGLEPIRFTDDAPLKKPSLLFSHEDETPVLFVAQDGGNYLIFEEGVGVLLVSQAPSFTHGIRLGLAENRAW